MNTTATRMAFAIQSTTGNYRGPGLFYRKHTGTRRGRGRDWVPLEDATTWPNYAAAVRQQQALDVANGGTCGRVVELEMHIRLRGETTRV